MKRTWFRALIILLIICLAAIFVAPPLFQFPVIGSVYGIENEFIEINGETYERKADRPYTSVDRGRYLGSVKNEKMIMRVYDVKGDESDHWLFTLWDWEGYFYCRTQEK